MRLFEVQGSAVERDTEIIMQVLDTLVPGREGSYLAAPISTGRRYFQALAEHNATTFSDLLARIGEEEYLRRVRWPNVEDGEAIAARLRLAGVEHLINTGPIFIKGWVGRDYMKLCFALLERKIKKVYFHPEWAYSSGAVKEFLFCTERGIPTLTPEGKQLTREDAGAALTLVRAHLEDLSLATDAVETYLVRMQTLLSSKDTT